MQQFINSTLQCAYYSSSQLSFCSLHLIKSLLEDPHLHKQAIWTPLRELWPYHVLTLDYRCSNITHHNPSWPNSSDCTTVCVYVRSHSPYSSQTFPAVFIVSSSSNSEHEGTSRWTQVHANAAGLQPPTGLMSLDVIVSTGGRPHWFKARIDATQSQCPQCHSWLQLNRAACCDWRPSRSPVWAKILQLSWYSDNNRLQELFLLTFFGLYNAALTQKNDPRLWKQGSQIERHAVTLNANQLRFILDGYVSCLPVN